jgi:hypothetical protein
MIKASTGKWFLGLNSEEKTLHVGTALMGIFRCDAGYDCGKYCVRTIRAIVTTICRFGDHGRMGGGCRVGASE